MKSKTLQLINYYTNLIKEQGEDPSQMPQEPGMEQPQQGAPPPPQEAPEPEETAPMTSEGENEYITNLINAALFKPSAEDAKTLMNLQNVMQLKRYTNAREEVLPMVLSIISSESQSGDLKQNMDQLT
jgi:hypothetical protein